MFYTGSDIIRLIDEVDKVLYSLTLEEDGSYLTAGEIDDTETLIFNPTNRQTERIEMKYADNGIKVSVFNVADEVSVMLPLPAVAWYPLVYANHPAFPSVLRLIYGDTDNVTLAISDLKALNADVSVEETSGCRNITIKVGDNQLICNGVGGEVLRFWGVKPSDDLIPYNYDPSLIFEKIINDLFPSQLDS